MSAVHVIYHDACPDGLTAAWLLLRALPGATAIGYSYEGPCPEPGAELTVIADVSFPEETLCSWSTKCRKVVLLDHHLTAKDALEHISRPLDDTLRALVDPSFEGLAVSIELDHSGAALAAAAAIVIDPQMVVPDWVQDVEDRDLWLWRRPHSREVCAGFDSLTGRSPDTLDVLEGLSRDELATLGSPLIAAFDAEIAKQCDAAVLLRIGTWTVPMTRVSDHAHGSFAASELLRRFPDAPFAAYAYLSADNFYIGLRSTNDRLDVAAVAEMFGGGGHRNSAAFRTRDLGSLSSS